MAYRRRLGPQLSEFRMARWAFQEVDYWLWRVGGSGDTPARQKARLLARAATAERRTFIETGTYHGDMLARLTGVFDQLYSVERDPGLYRSAVRRFRSAPHVTLYHDDSALALGAILARAKGPSVVWLDAHPTPGEPGEIPLLSELVAVFKDRGGGHRVLIDDVRGLSGEGGWPSLTEIVLLLHRSERVTHLSVAYDMMAFNVEPAH